MILFTMKQKVFNNYPTFIIEHLISGLISANNYEKTII